MFLNLKKKILTPKFSLIDCEKDGAGLASSILIKSGKFKGIRFYIGDVGFVNNRLRFKTQIVENPNNIDTESQKLKLLFTRCSGLILESLLTSSYKNKAPVLIRKE